MPKEGELVNLENFFNHDILPHLNWELVHDLLLAGAKGLPYLVVVFGPALVTFWLTRRAYRRGDMKDLIQISTNFFDAENGRILMKPRTIGKLQPAIVVFPHDLMSQKIIRAARAADPKRPEKAIVVIDDEKVQKWMVKRVIDAVSEGAAQGHLDRMFGHDVYEDEAFAVVSVADDGSAEIIRIDLIDKKVLRKFLNPAYRQSLSAREEEGSHDDMAQVFEIVAHEVFDRGDPTVERKSNKGFRVSMPRPRRA